MSFESSPFCTCIEFFFFLNSRVNFLLTDSQLGIVLSSVDTGVSRIKYQDTGKVQKNGSIMFINKFPFLGMMSAQSCAYCC